VGLFRHPSQLRPKDGQHTVALRAGKGLLDFAEARAESAQRAKYKKPVVLPGFAAQWPCAVKKRAGGDLIFWLLLYQDKSN
jgi:hypothetical protein